MKLGTSGSVVATEPTFQLPNVRDEGLLVSSVHGHGVSWFCIASLHEVNSFATTSMC